ncbi:MAG: hypothetical protein EZS28_049681, partial [Streblomastix strix]
GLYGLYGYAVLAHEGKDISPSITWLIKMGPKKIIYKNVPDEYKSLLTEIDLPQTCLSVYFVYTAFAINHGGFVDSACIPNTEVPDDTTKCADGSEITAYLVGFKSGTFIGKVDDMKEAILRFGPVWAVPGGLVVGWKDTNWITVESTYLSGSSYTLGTTPIITDGQYSGLAIFDGVSVVRAALSVIVAAVVLPALTLFF